MCYHYFPILFSPKSRLQFTRLWMQSRYSNCFELSHTFFFSLLTLFSTWEFGDDEDMWSLLLFLPLGLFCLLVNGARRKHYVHTCG